MVRDCAWEHGKPSWPHPQKRIISHPLPTAPQDVAGTRDHPPHLYQDSGWLALVLATIGAVRS